MCATLFAAVPAGAQAAQTPRLPWLGVMADGPLTVAGDAYPAEWSLIGSSGVSFVRTAFYWSQIQPAGAAAPPDFTVPDQTVLQAAQQGLVVLPVVLGTPAWAAVKPGVGAVPRDPGDYAALLRLLVQRYGPGGTFWAAHPELRPQPVRSWQVWNEPSLRLYWNRAGWVRGYTALLRAAHAAIHRLDPGATVVLAGLPNYSWRDLDELYAAGARRSFDAAAIHPYTGTPEGVITITTRNRKVMREHGDARKPIWLTEITWPTSRRQRPGWQGWEVTPGQQADRIAAALPLLADKRRNLRIGRVSWYTWASTPDGRSWESYAGLRTLRDGKATAKPGYTRFRRVVGRLAR